MAAAGPKTNKVRAAAIWVYRVVWSLCSPTTEVSRLAPLLQHSAPHTIMCCAGHVTLTAVAWPASPAASVTSRGRCTKEKRTFALGMPESGLILIFFCGRDIEKLRCCDFFSRAREAAFLIEFFGEGHLLRWAFGVSVRASESRVIQVRAACDTKTFSVTSARSLMKLRDCCWLLQSAATRIINAVTAFTHRKSLNCSPTYERIAFIISVRRH
jgi:hypothetical protein